MDDDPAVSGELEYARYPLATLLEAILLVVAVIGGIRVLMYLAGGNGGAAAFANLIVTVGATFGAVLLSITTQAARDARSAAHYCRKLAEREMPR